MISVNVALLGKRVCISQGSPEKPNIYNHSCNYRGWEVPHTCSAICKLEVHKTVCPKAWEQGEWMVWIPVRGLEKMVKDVPAPQWGSPLCSIQTLSRLDEVHPHRRGQSSGSADSNVNLIWKHPHKHTWNNVDQMSGHPMTQAKWHIKLSTMITWRLYFLSYYTKSRRLNCGYRTY